MSQSFACRLFHIYQTLLSEHLKLWFSLEVKMIPEKVLQNDQQIIHVEH